MKTAKSRAAKSDAVETARVLAPEDVRPGDFVSLWSESCEWPSYFWCCTDWAAPREQMVRLAWRSAEAGVPLRVEAVCLPFVLATNPDGQSRTLDLQRCTVARLSPKYAREARKRLRASAQGRRPPGGM